MNEDRIKVNASVENIRYFKDNFGIIVCSIDNIKSGKLRENDENNVVFKGQMPEPQKGAMYTIIADYVEDPKWGGQYNIQSMWTTLDFGENDEMGKKKFLSSIFTPNQLEAMYDKLKDPFETLKNHDIASLVTVRGCALKTASNWVQRFSKNYKYAKIYIELEDYGLTNNMIDKLLRKYQSPDLVIEKVKKNPYVLVNEVEGIGWKKADSIALTGGINPYGELRVSEFIKFYLNRCGVEGVSWLTTDQLLGAILDELGEEVTDSVIMSSIKQLNLWFSEDKTKIGLQKYRTLADNIAKELIRIRDGETDINYEGWKKKIQALEERQGWCYTEEQKNGIETALENNICLIQGMSGTGKSTTVNGVLEALSNYSHVMCALSGRAAARLAEITGEEGFTIHRLLGFPKGEPSHGGYVYHQDNQLFYDIYILDEISMVDAYLFYDLIRAIPTGAKLLMLGDPGQLESIGCGNIAFDMFLSEEIPTVMLTKIHRQAAKSAIITESFKVRNGEQIVPEEWSGKEVRGELKDLEIDCYLDASNSYYKVMEYFQRVLSQKDFNILETQILVPVKKRGNANTYALNNDIQELYNPAKKGKREEKVMTLSSGLRIFREGDKIINTVNNYKTEPAIFNGNIGIIKGFSFIEGEDSAFIEVMKIDFVGIGRVMVPKEYWGNLDLGYAITVHKYQGSESDNIIFNLDFASYSLLTRQLIYTGITRAKKKCYLIAQTNALRYGIAQEAVSRKQTHLQECLYEVTHPKMDW